MVEVLGELTKEQGGAKMQSELITEVHRNLLKNDFGLTFEDIEKMSDEELDNFLAMKLAMAECDEDEKTNGDELTERGKLIGEIIDILCGPYNEDDEDGD